MGVRDEERKRGREIEKERDRGESVKEREGGREKATDIPQHPRYKR
jgi:hypothetical protein